MISTNGYTYRLYGMFHWSFYEMFTYLGAEPTISVWLLSLKLFSFSYTALTLGMFFLQETVIYSCIYIDEPVKTYIWKWNSVWQERLRWKKKNQLFYPEAFFFAPLFFFSGQGNASDHVSTPFGRVYFINYYQTFKQGSLNSLNNAKC